MTFQTTYRLYLGERAFDFLTQDAAEREQRYQIAVNGVSPVIYEVVKSYQGEQLVEEKERAIPEG